MARAPGCPAISAGLSLQPSPLQLSFWREKSSKLMRGDAKVLLIKLLMLLVITPNWINKLGWQRYITSYIPTWLLLISWALALSRPGFYAGHRTSIVVLVRLFLGYIGAQTSNDMKDQIWLHANFESAKLTVLYKFILLANTIEVLIEAIALQLPLPLQLMAICVRVLCLLPGGCTREFVRWGESDGRRYARAADEMNRTWGMLVQTDLSGTALPQHASLAGRSSEVLLCLTLLHITTLLAVGYASYINLWLELRLWVAWKVQALRRSPGTDMAEIGGVHVSAEQLKAMVESPAAELLLNSRGLYGWLTMPCLHVSVLGIICQLSFVLSQLLVYELFPQLLLLLPSGGLLLDEFYPLQQLLEAGVTAAAAAAEQ